MKRRDVLKTAIAVPLLTGLLSGGWKSVFAATKSRSRVRPGNPGWPSPADWDRLKADVGGRLLKLESPFAGCTATPMSAACSEALQHIKNPYYLGDQPALTQTSGWLDAWTSRPSAYAVAAETTADVVAAVNFAREHNLRLVVKGGGHSYQGTSDAPDSLLVWTRHMHRVTLHDAFIAQGCEGTAPQPAVTIEAGAMWVDAYNAVTTRGGRYVQGGGCMTVGVAGLVQSGGFGSSSKNYGSAAAGLLEAEIVTADGSVRIANACTNPDLFWGIKGGGGGSLGVVTRLTLRTRELPEFFGAVMGEITASTGRGVSRLDRKGDRLLPGRAVQPALGRATGVQARHAATVDVVPGIDPATGRTGLGTVHRMGARGRGGLQCFGRNQVPRAPGATHVGRGILRQERAGRDGDGRSSRRGPRSRAVVGQRGRGRTIPARISIGVAARFPVARGSSGGAGRCPVRQLPAMADVAALQQGPGGCATE